MTKKYNSNNITYSQKERLNKIGIGNYDYHYLEDLEQILRCENWAKNNRSYTRSKYQIQQEKFQERIKVYPKDWCRIS